MADSTTVCIYTALDRDSRSIRLLNILPELSSDGLVQCAMHHTTIEASDNEYSCLSYVWGPPTEDLHAITVNGGVVHIRPNLFNFLSDARTRFTEKRLWIDALCIDQSNILERNHQVQQMGDIYSHASEVLVWLDEPYLELSQSKVETVLRDLENGKFSDIALYTISNIGLNKYWSRTWIVQEFVLAKRIYILLGPLTLSLADFKRLCGIAKPFKLFMISSIIQYRDKYIKQDPTSPPITISHFLLDCYPHLRECTNQRDRIFSLRAICVDGLKLTVDYSIPWYELMMSVLKLEEGRLCFCYIETVYWCMTDTYLSDPTWQYTLRFQIPSTKQPQNSSSEIDTDEIHELDLGLATKSLGGKLSWCNGIITHIPIDYKYPSLDVSKIRFVKNSQGGSLWRFCYWDMVNFLGRGHTRKESCLRDPSTITIGKWEL